MPALRPPCDEGVLLAAPPCPPAAARTAAAAPDAGPGAAAAETAGDAASGSDGPWILAATILGSSMAFIDGTAVNVALPALRRDLRAPVARVHWGGGGYCVLA